MTGAAEFAAQAADGDGDGVGERVGVLVPDLFEQVLGAEEGRAGAQQGLQQGELLDRQVELPAVAGGGAAERVELDAGRAQRPGARGGPAAGQRADAQDQLGEVERLGEVVVGAQRQAADPVAGRAGGGQHQHHRRGRPAR